MTPHHRTAKGLAVYDWADVPKERRATFGQVAEWMPEHRGLKRNAALAATLLRPGCRAAVLPNPWWDRPKPYTPCRNKPTHGDWCWLHAPSAIFEGEVPARTDHPAQAAVCRIGDC